VDTDLITGAELWQWRKWALKLAIERDVSDYEVDWLLRAVTNVDRLTLRLKSIGDRESVQSSVSLDRLSALWLDRLDTHKPVQYLVGKTYWRDFELFVSPAVLIPRPETESTIDIALAASNILQQQGIWVDLGTGSGAIAIGLARELPDANIFAVDCSLAALEIAQSNVRHLDAIDSSARKLSQRIHFSQGNWWSSLEHLQGQVAGMLSNPPYIPSAEVLRLQPEVTNHEPHLALDGGVDGLAAIRLLVDTAPNYLQDGGIWLIEMMAGQGELVRDLLIDRGNYTDIQIIDDLAGLDRFVLAKIKR
jgi:release factor glutamine methyltransferase